MPRLIDAEKLEDALHDLMKRRGINCWMSTVFDATDFEMLIDEAPTVEVEPVRRGVWEIGSWNIGIKCSECGKWLNIEQGDADMNYCPHCGANMKGEEING